MHRQLDGKRAPLFDESDITKFWGTKKCTRKAGVRCESTKKYKEGRCEACGVRREV